MSFWDDVQWKICQIMEPLGEKVFSGLGSSVEVVDKVVSTGIDVVGGGLDSAIEAIVENPGKSLLIATATIVTGGLASAVAGPIAATIGTTGLLGSATTGTAISTLSGAALESAALAALGGGALGTGGGMALGTTVVTIAGSTAGAAVSGGAVAVTNSSS